MIATTIEQSKKLVEFGIDVNTADMTYNAIVVSGEDKMLINGWTLRVGLDSAIKDNDFSYRNGYTIPAWSLSKLLELMPIKMSVHKDDYGKFYAISDNSTDFSIAAINPLDTAFEMMCYLLEIKLI